MQIVLRWHRRVVVTEVNHNISWESFPVPPHVVTLEGNSGTKSEVPLHLCIERLFALMEAANSTAESRLASRASWCFPGFPLNMKSESLGASYSTQSDTKGLQQYTGRKMLSQGRIGFHEVQEEFTTTNQIIVFDQTQHFAHSQQPLPIFDTQMPQTSM